MSAITVGDDLIHYEVLGRGRPVILLHGWIGSWRYWIPTMQQLQLKYRVYALDLYGFGDSGKNPRKYTLDEQANLVRDFMKELSIQKTALIGHSLGALVAAKFAQESPDSVKKFLSISMPLFDPGDLAMRVPAGHRVLLTAPTIVKPEITEPSHADATLLNPSAAARATIMEAARARANGEPPPNPPEMQDITMPRSEVTAKSSEHNPLQERLGGAAMDSLLEKCFKRSEPEFEKLRVDAAKTDLAALRQSVTRFDSGRTLDMMRSLQMPTMIIHGADDNMLPVPGEEVWKYITVDRDDHILPVPLPGVRHFPMLEYERFFRLASDFLEAEDISKIEIKERWIRRTR